jgi:hypothetical protein
MGVTYNVLSKELTEFVAFLIQLFLNASLTLKNSNQMKKFLFAILVGLTSVAYGQVKIEGVFLNNADSVDIFMYTSDGEGDWNYEAYFVVRNGFVVDDLKLNKLYGFTFYNRATRQEIKLTVSTVKPGVIDDLVLHFSKDEEPLDTRCETVFYDGKAYKVAVVL